MDFRNFQMGGEDNSNGETRDKILIEGSGEDRKICRSVLNTPTGLIIRNHYFRLPSSAPPGLGTRTLYQQALMAQGLGVTSMLCSAVREDEPSIDFERAKDRLDYLSQEIDRLEKELNKSGLPHEEFEELAEELEVMRFEYSRSENLLEDAGSSGFIGYSVWPKLGYDGPLKKILLENLNRNSKYKYWTPPDILEHLVKTKAMADVPLKTARLSDLMKTEKGRRWWMVNGDSVDLTFDLTPQPDGSQPLSMQILEEYVTKKAASFGMTKDEFLKIATMTPGKKLESIPWTYEDEKLVEKLWDEIDQGSETPSSHKVAFCYSLRAPA